MKNRNLTINSLILALMLLAIPATATSLAADDAMMLTDGRTIQCSVKIYNDGLLTVELPNGVEKEGVLGDVAEIIFDTAGGELDDELMLKDGQLYSCSVISYMDGHLTVKLADGTQRTDSIDTIDAFNLSADQSRPSFLDLPGDPGFEMSNANATETLRRNRPMVKITGEADSPPRLEMEVMRSLEIERDAIRTADAVSVSVNLTNQEIAREVGPFTCHLLLVTRSAADTQQYRLLEHQEFAIESLAPLQTFTWDGPTVNTKAYRSGSGYKYGGWILMVLNSNDEVVAVKATKETWEKNYHKIAQMGNRPYFNFHLEPLQL